MDFLSGWKCDALVDFIFRRLSDVCMRRDFVARIWFMNPLSDTAFPTLL